MNKAETPKFEALVAHLGHHCTAGEVLLMGSAPLAVRGLRDVNDLDVLVGVDKFVRLVGMRIPDSVIEDGCLAIITPAGQIQISSNPQAHIQSIEIPYAELWRDAEKHLGVNGFLVMSLAHMMEVKLKAGRPKDGDDVRLARLWLQQQ